MNARTEPAAHMAPLAVEHLPLAAIRPSPTEIQRLRRARFSPEALLELAASIQAQGVLEPILVRAIPPDLTTQYEIVAGERRWLAAERAGLAHVPAIVRDMTEAQAIEAQLTENLQRENYSPLEEGAGYKALMDLEALDAEALGRRIGKSRAYIYARRKLCELIPEAREALQAGKIGSEKALLIARLPEKLQTKALAIVAETTWHGPISYARAFAVLKEKCFQPLAGAPFALDDATLFLEEKAAGKPDDKKGAKL